MTGHEKDNLPAFIAAATALRANEFDIVTPVELASTDSINAVLAGSAKNFNEIDGTTWGEALGRDIEIIADEVTGLIFLDGWEKSRGARLEAFTAIVCGHDLARYLPGGHVEAMTAQLVLAKLMRHTAEDLRNVDG